eukprot:GHVT01013766.1.p1 GENE.GHVT01013766.1~~GHVT01013766.1.p1  ORF type:complete len:144 (-),score=17.69 GHVT01013766.1:1022-1453(-)
MSPAAWMLSAKGKLPVGGMRAAWLCRLERTVGARLAPAGAFQSPAGGYRRRNASANHSRGPKPAAALEKKLKRRQGEEHRPGAEVGGRKRGEHWRQAARRGIKRWHRKIELKGKLIPRGRASACIFIKVGRFSLPAENYFREM